MAIGGVQAFVAVLAIGVAWILVEKAAVDLVSYPSSQDDRHGHKDFDYPRLQLGRSHHENVRSWIEGEDTAAMLANEHKIFYRDFARSVSGRHSRRSDAKIGEDVRIALDHMAAMKKKLEERSADETAVSSGGSADQDMLNHHEELTAAFSRIIGDLSSYKASADYDESRYLLSQPRDYIHDNIWKPYCKKAHPTRGCRRARDPFLKGFIATQLPAAFFFGAISLLVLFDVFHTKSFAYAIQVVLTIVIARFVRTLSFVGTTFAPINLNCRVIFKGATESGGCGDLVFSGHGCVVAAYLCVVWTQSSPRLPTLVRVLLTIVGLHSIACSVLERFHYTVDMWLALVVTVLVWLCLARVVGYDESRKGKAHMPLSSMALVTVVSAAVVGAMYAALRFLDVLH